MTWLWLALATAFFESFKDFFAKKSVSSRMDLNLVAWATHALAIPWIAAVVCFQPWPQIDVVFLQAVVVSAALNAISALLMVHAFAAADLSLAIPMLTLSPLFMLVTSPLMIGEFPKALALLGMVFIVAGSYLLNIDHRRNGWLGPFRAILSQKGPRYMLGVALVWSICANIDKIGVQHSSPWAWALGFEIGVTGIMSLLLAPRLWGARWQMLSSGHRLLPIGFCGAAAMLFHMQAITLTLVPHVVAVKRVSVLLSVLWGGWFLGEGELRQRMMGVLIMLGGACL